MAKVEFQKRGLPHVHILIILGDHDREMTSDWVDSVVVAEIPPHPEDTDNSSEATERRRLREIVLSNMIHGPCGASKKPMHGKWCMYKKLPKKLSKGDNCRP